MNSSENQKKQWLYNGLLVLCIVSFAATATLFALGRARYTGVPFVAALFLRSSPPLS